MVRPKFVVDIESREKEIQHEKSLCTDDDIQPKCSRLLIRTKSKSKLPSRKQTLLGPGLIQIERYISLLSIQISDSRKIPRSCILLRK